MPPLLRLCAGEAVRLGGETVPLDQGPDGVGRLGLTLRVPVGVVVAITPFNYPLLLVAHKLGPAFAAGNSVILKPSTVTPLVACASRSCSLRPELILEQCSALQVQVPAWGRRCADERVRAITFTGSEPVGRAIVLAAGVKRFLLELGANSH